LAVMDVENDWYASAFKPEMADMAWAENTGREVDRLIRMLRPNGSERVLDLACGNGRHALELTRRGFTVVGVELAGPLLEVAREDAARAGLEVTYLQADLRELEFEEEFDLVLNLDSGAIGYFESEEENLRTFAAAARALRSGGRQLMQLPNVLHAEAHLPKKTWIEGTSSVELLDQKWNKKDRSLYGSMHLVRFGDTFDPDDKIAFRQRLYSIQELDEILRGVEMRVTNAFRGNGKAREPDDTQFEIFVEGTKVS
jgi:SAM-dependent methyltransferase